MDFNFDKIEKRAQSYESNALSMLSMYGLNKDPKERVKLLRSVSRFTYLDPVLKEWLKLAVAETDNELKAEFCLPLLRSYKIQNAYAEVPVFLSTCLNVEKFFDSILNTSIIFVKNNNEVLKNIILFYQKNENLEKKAKILESLYRTGIKSDLFLNFLNENLLDLKTNQLFMALTTLLDAGKIESSKIRYYLKSWTDYPQEILLAALLKNDSNMYEEYIKILENNVGHRSERFAFDNIVKKSSDLKKDLEPALRKKTVEQENLIFLNYMKSFLKDEEFKDLLMNVYKKTSDEAKKEICLLNLSYFVGEDKDISDFYAKSISSANKENEITNLIGHVFFLIDHNNVILDEICNSYDRIKKDVNQYFVLNCLGIAKNENKNFISLYSKILKENDDKKNKTIINHLSKLDCNEITNTLFTEVLLLDEIRNFNESELLQIVKKWRFSKLFTPEESKSVSESLLKTDHKSLKEFAQSWTGREQKFEEADSSVIDNWLVEIKKNNIEGIFPLVYSYYDTFPEKALEIIKYTLLNSDKFSGPKDMELYVFLYQKRAIDVDIAKYAMTKFMKNPTDVRKENYPPIFLCGDSDWINKQIPEILDKIKGSRDIKRLGSYLVIHFMQENLNGISLEESFAMYGEKMPSEIKDFLCSYGFLKIGKVTEAEPVKTVGGFLDE